MLSICTNVNINAVKYSECITRVESVLPSVGKLVDSLTNRDAKDIILDISQLALELLNGIAYCMSI